jgi:hypothetical protein
MKQCKASAAASSGAPAASASTASNTIAEHRRAALDGPPVGETSRRTADSFAVITTALCVLSS